jgi:hypothetical protein
MKSIKSIILLASILSVILVLSPIPASASSSNLSPSPSTLNLIVGSAGSGIHITYSGSISPPSGAVSCDVSVSFVSGFGLTPKLDGNPTCDIYNKYVSIPITFDGAYNGQTGTYNPISYVTVKYYNVNGTFITSETLYSNPITINKVTLDVNVPGNPISGSPHYDYTPDNPKTGQTIRIYVSSTVVLTVQTSQPADVSAQLILRYYQSTIGTHTENFEIPAGTTTTNIYIDNADISAPLHYQILSGDGSMVIAEGDIDLPSYTSASAENVMFVLEQPYTIASVDPNSNTVTVVGGVYVMSIPSSGSLTVTMSIGDASNSTTITESGMVTLTIQTSGGGSSGTYSVVYSGSYGSVSITVPFSAMTSRISTGGVVTNIFYYTFIVIITASFTASIAGFLLRRPDLMSSGLLGMASSILIFIIPTVMSYVIQLLFATGVSNPAHISNINMMNLGNAVDRSVQYTTNMAIAYGNELRNIAITLLGIIAALAGIASGVGIIGWLTGGALSQFIGKVAGEFGAQLIMISVYSFLAGYMLKVLAYVYPIVLNTVLIILFFTVVVYAIYASFTGNIGQAYGPIIQFSILILAILLVPPMLGTIDELKNTSGVGKIPMPFPINKVISSIPNPFFWIATSLMQIVILVTIMYMAFQRLVTILGGGGG